MSDLTQARNYTQDSCILSQGLNHKTILLEAQSTWLFQAGLSYRMANMSLSSGRYPQDQTVVYAHASAWGMNEVTLPLFYKG